MDDPVETDRGSRKPVDGVTRLIDAFEGLNNRSPLPIRSVGTRLCGGILFVQCVAGIAWRCGVAGCALDPLELTRRTFLWDFTINALSQKCER